MSVFFLWKIDEVGLSAECAVKQERLKQLKAETHPITSEPAIAPRRLRLLDWLGMPTFYIFGVCFVAVKLYTNLFGTFVLFYLRFVLELGIENGSTSDSINFSQALIPLIICLSSVAANLSLSWFYGRFGRKTALMLGGVFCAGTSTGMYFLSSSVSWPIYPISVLVGIAQPFVLSTGLNLISEVVGIRG